MNKMILPQTCELFTRINGFSRVKDTSNGKWNIVNELNEFISSVWFDSVSPVRDGQAVVTKHGKYNILLTSAEIGDIWVPTESLLDKIHKFIPSTTKFTKHLDASQPILDQTPRGYRYRNKNGVIITNRFYKDAKDFVNGYARVQNKLDQWSFLNISGVHISKLWYNRCGDFSRSGLALVFNVNNEFNVINITGRLIYDNWLNIYKHKVADTSNPDEVYKEINKRNLQLYNLQMTSY